MPSRIGYCPGAPLGGTSSNDPESEGEAIAGDEHCPCFYSSYYSIYLQ